MSAASIEATTSDSALMGFISIGDAADLVGVSRSTLRIWERESLISPRRTEGGHRLYSPEDVDRLREIAHLRNTEQLNAAAIRRVLGPARSTPNGDAQSELGQRLRTLRTDRGWSLAHVAERSGLSISFLSSVERGTSSISVGNLFKVADAYGTTVPRLGADPTPDPRSMVHPSDRPRFVAGSGLVVIEDLIACPGALEAQRIEIQPGGGSGEAYTHPGEEFIYVLSGCLHFLIEETEHYELTEGDSLFFRSERSHRWWNDRESAATVLWMNVPLVQSAPGGSGPRVQAEGR